MWCQIKHFRLENFIKCVYYIPWEVKVGCIPLASQTALHRAVLQLQAELVCFACVPDWPFPLAINDSDSTPTSSLWPTVSHSLAGGEGGLCPHSHPSSGACCSLAKLASVKKSRVSVPGTMVALKHTTGWGSCEEGIQGLFSHSCPGPRACCSLAREAAGEKSRVSVPRAPLAVGCATAWLGWPHQKLSHRHGVEPGKTPACEHKPVGAGIWHLHTLLGTSRSPCKSTAPQEPGPGTYTPSQVVSGPDTLPPELQHGPP